jgi:four helix bundle protein
MRDFTKYNVWNESVELSVLIYKISTSFPNHEVFGLTSQMRRAAVSVTSNFAEGCSRSSQIEFKRFLEIALGSSFELKTQLMISQRLEYITQEEFDKILTIIDIINKQLNSLRTKISNSNKNQSQSQ